MRGEMPYRTPQTEKPLLPKGYATASTVIFCAIQAMNLPIAPRYRTVPSTVTQNTRIRKYTSATVGAALDNGSTATHA